MKKSGRYAEDRLLRHESEGFPELRTISPEGVDSLLSPMHEFERYSANTVSKLTRQAKMMKRLQCFLKDEHLSILQFAALRTETTRTVGRRAR